MDRIKAVKELIRNLQLLIDGHVECLPYDIIISIALMASGLSSKKTSLSFNQYVRTRLFVIGLGTRECYKHFVRCYLPQNIKDSDIGLLCAYNKNTRKRLAAAINNFNINFNNNQEVIYLMIPNAPEDVSSEFTTSSGNIILKQYEKMLPSVMAALQSDSVRIRIHIAEPYARVRNLPDLETTGIILNNKYVPILAIRGQPVELIDVNLPRCERLCELAESVSYHWLTTS